MGVTYDRELTYRTHIEMAYLRKISWLLDGRGLETLYKTQVRSFLEFACLAWMGVANKHLNLLDKVQDRAARLITDSDAGHETRRRDVAGFTVVYKV